MRRKISILLLISALILGVVLPASAYTLTGTGYVVTDDIISVVVPTTLDFKIDPFEIDGRGSVYSNEYPLVNVGDTDVILTFTSIDVVFANETDFAPKSVPIDDSYSSGLKEAYLVLDFGNSEVSSIVLTDSQRWENPVITLAASNKQNSEYSLSISGNVSSHPDIDWQSGDIQISITYQLDSVVETENSQLFNPAMEHILIEKIKNQPIDELIMSDETTDESPVMDGGSEAVSDISNITDGNEHDEKTEIFNEQEEQNYEQSDGQEIDNDGQHVDTGEQIESETGTTE